MFNLAVSGLLLILDRILSLSQYVLLNAKLIQYDNSTFLAGQIGLIPSTMEFPSPQSTAMEAAISLQHIFRVARAVNVDPLIGLEGVVAYLVREEDVQIVAETWKNSFEDAPQLAIVLVDGLPRGARVEWHVIRCQKSSDEVSRPKVQMAVEECQVVIAINALRGGHGVLCIVFGSQEMIPRITSRYQDVAVQTIPSRAVYSVDEGIVQHKSCTFILSE
jgi:enamine deaminase RidA (YjgF/YER057c/UK114 family)